MQCENSNCSFRKLINLVFVCHKSFIITVRHILRRVNETIFNACLNDTTRDQTEEPEKKSLDQGGYQEPHSGWMNAVREHWSGFRFTERPEQFRHFTISGSWRRSVQKNGIKLPNPGHSITGKHFLISRSPENLYDKKTKQNS